MAWRQYYQYYRRWLTRAFNRAWTISTFFAALLGILIPLVLIPLAERHFPTRATQVPDLAWEIPFWIFVALATIRILLVPFWLDREREQQVKDLGQEKERQAAALRETAQRTEAALRQRIAALERQLDERATRRSHREALARFIETGEQVRRQYLASDLVSDTAAREWVQEVHEYLRTHLDSSYVTRLESREGLSTSFLLRTDVPGENRRIYESLSDRLIRLHEFLKDFGVAVL